MKKTTTKKSQQKQILSATNARRDFFKIMEMAQNSGREIIITSDGEPKVIIMAYGDYEGLIETLDIMSDPEAIKGIKDGLEDFKHGRWHKWEEVKKELNLP